MTAYAMAGTDGAVPADGLVPADGAVARAAEDVHAGDVRTGEA